MSSQPQSPNPEPGVRDRRTVLRGVAVIGLAGAATPLLAACGGSSGTDAGSGTGASSAPTSQPTGSGSSAPAGGTALAKTSDIPLGGGKVFPDARVVVTQPAKGQFKCFTAVCTHMHCILADVNDGTINCGCHGSKFKIADGSVANGPASSPLAERPITVKGNEIIDPAT
jgi:nitrite reductase/ring-hydroxylating ferredoxin subunit